MAPRDHRKPTKIAGAEKQSENMEATEVSPQYVHTRNMFTRHKFNPFEMYNFTFM